jgi:lipopolysaccharide export system ATP-binding protein
MNKVLRIDNIFKSYKHKKVINGISFSVGQGEAIGLLGPNGAGKTTCFYMIAGLINVNSGKIFIDEVDITSLPMHQRASLGIGYLPQEASIFRGMNVEDNIMSVLEIVNSKHKERIEIMEKLLDEFSIQHIRKSHALSLSGGERRRVEIARTLATNPLFILLDEPFAGVDPIAINDIRQMITHLKNRGIGVLITDHNVRETLSIVDKGYIVYDGKILASGNRDEIINHQDVKRVYLGDSFSVN